MSLYCGEFAWSKGSKSIYLELCSTDTSIIQTLIPAAVSVIKCFDCSYSISHYLYSLIFHPYLQGRILNGKLRALDITVLQKDNYTIHVINKINNLGSYNHCFPMGHQFCHTSLATRSVYFS